MRILPYFTLKFELSLKLKGVKMLRTFKICVCILFINRKEPIRAMVAFGGTNLRFINF